MEEMKNTKIDKRGIFNEDGDLELSKRRIIQGNTTNLNDFNNLKYNWTMDWYRQNMNNFWIPEEININQDIRDYKDLTEEEKFAFDRFIASLSSLDSIQTSNLPNLQVYVTANEINLCLSIATFEETLHSEAYSHILATITDSDNADYIMHLYENDEKILARNEAVAEVYRDFLNDNNEFGFVKNLITNYIVEGLYFSSAYAFFYNFERSGKMTGLASVLKHINRDENKHLELFRNMINDLRAERADLFTAEAISEYRQMIIDAAEAEIDMAEYLIGDKIEGINIEDLTAYIKFLANERARGLAFELIYAGYMEIPASMTYIEEMAQISHSSVDFMEEKVASHTTSSFIEDDL